MSSGAILTTDSKAQPPDSLEKPPALYWLTIGSGWAGISKVQGLSHHSLIRSVYAWDNSNVGVEMQQIEFNTNLISAFYGRQVKQKLEGGFRMLRGAIGPAYMTRKEEFGLAIEAEFLETLGSIFYKEFPMMDFLSSFGIGLSAQLYLSPHSTIIGSLAINGSWGKFE